MNLTAPGSVHIDDQPFRWASRGHGAMRIDRATKIDRRRAQAAAGVGLIVLGVALVMTSTSLAQYPSALLNTGLALLAGVVLLGVLACREIARRTGSSFRVAVRLSVQLTRRLAADWLAGDAAVAVVRRDHGR